MARLRVAVLVSGNGSNLQTLIDLCSDADVPADIVCVISNKPGVFALERARAAGIATFVIAHGDYPDRAAFDQAIDRTLRAADVGLVCLAGFMRVLGADFVAGWHDRIINIHPSLLPAFRGLHTHRRALEAGVRIHGCSVHFVRADLDDGPIIVQAAVPVLPEDSEASLAARVLAAEHEAYPLALRLIAQGRCTVIDGRVRITGSPAGAATCRLNPSA